ncbi:exo-alpha-sialidase [Natrarchaeobius sp. A-rgal3]|uniref:COG1361 S-layer family protein n=1 Tax=Natrarchaeobius versutus TaxID=1679078 RepID=UPI00350F9887
MNERTVGIVVVVALAVITGAAGLVLAGGSTAADAGDNGALESVTDGDADDGEFGETVTKSVRTESEPALQRQQQPSGERTLIRGEPDLEVHAPEPKLQSGQTNEVPLQVSNSGHLRLGPSDQRELVTTARNVRVDADAGGTPLTVESGEVSVGSVTENQPNEVPLAISVPDDVDAGTYTIDLDVSYAHTYQRSGNGVTDDRSRTLSTSIDVEVDDEARFTITGAETDAQVGDSGTMEATVENVGDETARDVTVVLESSSRGFAFGESAQDSAWIDELSPGESVTVEYDVSVAPNAPVRGYTLDGTVQFKTSDGLQRVDESPSVGVTPHTEQQFSVTDVESDLYVGEDGDLHGVVVNDGPSDAENVVVRFAEQSPNVIPIEQRVSVGSLEAGESASFRLPLEVSGGAEPVARTIDLAVQYRNADFEQRHYDDLEVVADVEPKRDQFEVDVLEREIAAGDEQHVTVEVTNNLDETVTDVEARLFADDPLDSDDDEGFVEELEPGETVTMTFHLSADSSAVAKTYPVSFDFRYDDERGNSQLSDTSRVAIEVGESGGGIPGFLIGTIVLTGLGLGAGAYVYRRK